MNRFEEHSEEIFKCARWCHITEKDIWDFDPKLEYPAGKYTKALTERQQTLKLGKMSTLITEMVLAKATKDEMLRVVRHSIVLMDQRKYLLDWERSEIENRILELKIKYQGV